MSLHTVTTIRIKGHPNLAATFQSLTINERIDGHHNFQLTLPGQAFGAGKGTKYWRNLVGKRITIEIVPLKAPSNSSSDYTTKLFTGLVTGLEMNKSYGPNGHILLKGGSPTLLLDDDPHIQSFSGQSMRRIVQRQLQHYPVNLLRPEVNPVTTQSLDYVVQYKENTWEFLQRLARIHGEWFYYNGEKVIFGRRTPETIALTHDKDLDHFSLQMGIQSGNMKVAGYEYAGDTTVQSDTQSPSGLNDHSQSVVDTSKGLFPRQGHFQPNHPLNGSASRQVKTMAKRRQDSSVAGMVRMNGQSHHPGLGVGDEISIEENVYGNEAYGNFMLTEVHHHCSSDGDYHNNFSGIPADVATPPHRLEDHPTAEAQSAIVVDNNDPDDLGRIQVQFRWQEGRTPWIRTTSPSGGKGKGLYMIPEKGEEVMVDFTGGNPEQPYVLGSAWNGGGPSGFGTPKNDVKAIKTRSGHTIELNDAKGGEFITIKDKNGNSIHMDTKNKSITINAPEDMTLNAKNMEMNIQENLKVNVGKSKTERIKEDHNLEAKNSTTKIIKKRMVRSGEKTEQQAGELTVHTSNGDMVLDGTGKVTIQSNDRIDFGE